MKTGDEDDEHLERASCLLDTLPLYPTLNFEDFELDKLYGCISVPHLDPFLNTNCPFKAETDLAYFFYLLQLTIHSRR